MFVTTAGLESAQTLQSETAGRVESAHLELGLADRFGRQLSTDSSEETSVSRAVRALLLFVARSHLAVTVTELGRCCESRRQTVNEEYRENNLSSSLLDVRVRCADWLIRM